MAADQPVRLWTRTQSKKLTRIFNLIFLEGLPDENKYEVCVSESGVTIVDPRLSEQSPTGRPRTGPRHRKVSRFLRWDEIESVDEVPQRFAQVILYDGSLLELSIGHLASTDPNSRTQERASKVAQLRAALTKHAGGSNTPEL